MLFTAANVYAGLKVGLTFATSIPAAVVSMAILRAVREHATSWRTTSSRRSRQRGGHAGGDRVRAARADHGRLVERLSRTGRPSRSARPGGVLGVMFSVPLRRALVTGSDLPYPEGVAAAEVLKVGVEFRGRRCRECAGPAHPDRARVAVLRRASALLAKMQAGRRQRRRKNFAVGGTATRLCRPAGRCC